MGKTKYKPYSAQQQKKSARKAFMTMKERLLGRAIEYSAVHDIGTSPARLRNWHRMPEDKQKATNQKQKD